MVWWFRPDNDDFGIDEEIHTLAKCVQCGLSRRRPVGFPRDGIQPGTVPVMADSCSKHPT